MTWISLICWMLVLCLLMWLIVVWRGMSQDWLPLELKDARLVYVEHNFFVDAPFPVVGRPDQVYRLPDGRHVPLENKNRNSYRVYDGDIAQLSLQAWLLRELGKPTADFGYVVINHRRTGKRQAVRVSLWSDAACEKLIERYLTLIDKHAKPHKSLGPKCKSCGHRGVCH